MKFDIKFNHINLIEYAEKNFGDNKELIDVLIKYKYRNNFIHSLYAIDLTKMKSIINANTDSIFDPNIADYSYVFTWYRPINRNLPKFLLECALDTKSIEIVEYLLDLNCNVNFPHTLNADPLYFYAYTEDFYKLKEKFIKNANFYLKNQKGHTVLFHLVYLYLKQNNVGYLIDEFKLIIKNNPRLIYQREQDGCTLVETIRLLQSIEYKKAKLFVKLINDFIFTQIIVKHDVDLFVDFIYNSYGLIILNTEFDRRCLIDGAFNIEDYHTFDDEINDSNDRITIEDYFKINYETENKCKLSEFKNVFEKYFNPKFLNLLFDFYKLIQIGEIDKIEKILNNNQDELNRELVLFKDYGGRSCLHIAVLSSNLSVLK